MSDNLRGGQLRHEVARVVPRAGEPGPPGRGWVISAPELYERCRGMVDHPLARNVEEASREERLLCVVCASPLGKKFGGQKIWHFATRAGSTSCNHEPESCAHRRAKLALRDALGEALSSEPEGEWEVREEVRLENGRRPDVLATNLRSGARVAFEVQYADLSVQELIARRLDYADLGIRDVWILGDTRLDLVRDALAAGLAMEPGQRTMYVFWPEDSRELHIQEGILSEPVSESGYPLRRPLAPGASGRLPPGRWVSYPAQHLRLSASGGLSTPADGVFRGLADQLEREQRAREREKRQEAEALRWRESRRQWAENKRAREAATWKESAERRRAVNELGSRLVEKLERETRLDKNIYTAPGRWKVGFYLDNIHNRPPGTAFDYFRACGKVLHTYGCNRGDDRWAWQALHAFRDHLQQQGFIEFDRRDERGSLRYWRTSVDPQGRREEMRAERQRIEEERARAMDPPVRLAGEDKFYRVLELRELEERSQQRE